MNAITTIENPIKPLAAVLEWLDRQPEGRVIEDRCGWQCLRIVAVESGVLPELAGDGDESDALDCVHETLRRSGDVLFMYAAHRDRWSLLIER